MHQRVPEMQLVKFADAQTMLRTLEAFSKRWRPGQTMDVVHHGVLRLPREGESAPNQPVIDAQHTEVFSDDADASEAQRPRLALASPCKTSDEMDELVRQGAFEVARPKPPVDEKSAEPTAPKSSNNNPLHVDKQRPLQGETSYMDKQVHLEPGSWAWRMHQANPYRDRSHDHKPNRDPHDPRRGSPGHAAGTEQTRGFKTV